MTPKRRAALEWVRDDGNKLDLPGRGEPTQRMLLRLDHEELIRFSTRFGRTWELTRQGAEALE